MGRVEPAANADRSPRPVEVLLEGLDPESWCVLHDVDLGRGSRVEHVVFGPPGVFTIGSTVQESGGHARVVRAFPLVVVDEIGDLVSPRSGAYSLRAEDLVPYLGSMAPHTSSEGVRALYRAAQKASTWSGSA
jgi:hypothetical protein